MATDRDVTMVDAQAQVDSNVTNDKRIASPTGNPHPKRLKSWWEKEEEEQEAQEVEKDRKDRIRRPWMFETRKPLCEPPDINYRQLILHDQEKIEKLLEDITLHFAKRCLRYKTFDVELELAILDTYQCWARQMLYVSCVQGEEERKNFLEDLYENLRDDWSDVLDELFESREEEQLPMAANGAQSNGTPEVWSTRVGKGAWYFYDKTKHQWLQEASKAGEFYEERKVQWREEALRMPERRYYDNVQRRFYHYDQDDQEWHGEHLILTRRDEEFLRYDKEKRQWSIPQPDIEILQKRREMAAQWRIEDAENNNKENAPPAQTLPPPLPRDPFSDDETCSSGYQTANEATPSPPPSPANPADTTHARPMQPRSFSAPLP